MSDEFTVYLWTPKNKSYLTKMLRLFERMGSYHQEHWIERKHSFFGLSASNLGEGGPGEDILPRELDVDIEQDSGYQSPTAFYRLGHHAVHHKAAFHYGRCMLYLCLITSDAYTTIISYTACVILHDRQTNKWYWCGILGDTSSLESFLVWLNHHI